VTLTLSIKDRRLFFPNYEYDYRHWNSSNCTMLLLRKTGDSSRPYEYIAGTPKRAENWWS